MKSLILSSEESQKQAEKLARYIGLEHKTISIRYFPDGESLVTLPLPLNEHLIVYFNLHNPNAKLIELILACSTARKKGVQRITLITPYLAYMRQDIENHPGEAISQQIIGEMLCNYIDDILTVDPHLHRIEKLSQAYPLKNAISLSAEHVIGDYIKKSYKDVLLLGPDGESQQWVSAAAERAGCAYGVATKVRQGDRSVVITLPEIDLDNKNIILIDDMISTGGTIIKIASLLKDRHSTIEAAIVTHCLCTDDDEQKILNSGVRKIISTESVPHSTNEISLTHLIGNAVKKII